MEKLSDAQQKFPSTINNPFYVKNKNSEDYHNTKTITSVNGKPRLIIKLIFSYGFIPYYAGMEHENTRCYGMFNFVTIP